MDYQFARGERYKLRVKQLDQENKTIQAEVISIKAQLTNEIESFTQFQTITRNKIGEAEFLLKDLGQYMRSIQAFTESLGLYKNESAKLQKCYSEAYQIEDRLRQNLMYAYGQVSGYTIG